MHDGSFGFVVQSTAGGIPVVQLPAAHVDPVDPAPGPPDTGIDVLLVCIARLYCSFVLLLLSSYWSYCGLLRWCLVEDLHTSTQQYCHLLQALLINILSMRFQEYLVEVSHNPNLLYCHLLEVLLIDILSMH